ncbi:WYL domain-containing protein [Gordonia sp. ABSL11-1]|uniref:helix-turn-helix transcriptional regulator n=1 Tax=Gordonia sp. ABSL11-1 TaxID=3053924 RepID=UPI002573579C|nr:WYL domain-containing protein [Gordonia sp. ABSL11-1]MDL9945476.1 WYL domain-containing protein [Gordonia sp. ABSL11-1]
MRAERLIAVLMLLKKHDRLTATAIAAELGVSERTVLRDIDALSLSGVPVYAERGRHGGFALLPGYRTDLTGLTVDEATSLLAGTGRLDSPAFASAMRKVTAALPDAHRDRAVGAAARVLVRPEGFVREPDRLEALEPVQRAVFDGRRLRVRYRRRGDDVGRERTIDPIGLIVAGDTWYLVATVDGDERMYRVSRMTDVEVLEEDARRPAVVDLETIWERRRQEFRSSFEFVDVVIDCRASDVDGLVGFADVLSQTEEDDDRVRLRLRFADRSHAIRVLWTGCFDRTFTIIEPAWVRETIRDRLVAVLDGFGA